MVKDDKSLILKMNHITKLYKELLENVGKCMLVNEKLVFKEEFERIFDEIKMIDESKISGKNKQ